jgi:hypothetical protein
MYSLKGVAIGLGAVRPGSIVICHMNHPGHGTAEGMRAALPALRDAGNRFVPVADHLRTSHALG